MSDIYIDILRTEYERRRSKNSAYSVRAFANFLGVHSSVLSAILKGKRGIPKKHIFPFIIKLNLDGKAKVQFVQSIAAKRNAQIPTLSESPKKDLVLNEEDHFAIIAEWEYYAVLNLVKTAGFKWEAKYVGHRLGISVVRAQEVMELLEKAQMVSVDRNGNAKRIEVDLQTTKDVFSTALRQSHKESLEIAAEKLESIPISDRYFGTTTMTMSLKKMEMAKDLLRKFRSDFCDLVETGSDEEVYQLSVQFFPLTNVKK